jgi:GNAT superfamily N-acetyltransferase
MSFEMLSATDDHLFGLQRNLQQAQAYKILQDDHGWDEIVFDTDHIAKIIERGNTYVASSAGRIAASLELVPSDPEIWGERLGADGTALYMHRFAISDGFRGTGLGRQCISWACQEVIKTERLHLRLDCNPDQTELNRYYQRNSFWQTGISYSAGYPTALYERRV